MDETFLPVVGWEDRYLVSDRGNVWSLYWGRKAKPQVYANGYFAIRLCDGPRREVRHVHSLVAEAFLGPRPPGFHVHHKDEDRLNNYVGNLEYKHKGRHIGEHQVGELGSNASLTEAEVKEILVYPRVRGSGVELARKYGVTPQCISMIRRGRSWSHLNPD